ncbi:conserved hypothetical protein, partial [Ricinus communis]
MDIHFVETARLVRLGGADVICHISNWLAERTPAPYWISRAVENNCYLIESNRWGLERGVQFSGGSCVIAPDGTIMASVDTGDGIASAELVLDGRTHGRASAWLPAVRLDERRPDKYLELITNPFTWNSLDFFRLYDIAPLPPGARSRVATVQFDPVADVERNLEAIGEIVATAVAKDRPALIVFPELAVTGRPDRTGGGAVSVPGPAADSLVSLAMRHGVYLVAGLAEQTQDGSFNTVVLVGPEGFVGSYRKMHLDRDDRDWARPGDEWRSFDTAIGRIGVLTGYDALFPESCRVLALGGCDLIACPSALKGRVSSAHPGTAVRQNFPIPTSADPHHWHHFRVRAGENN